MSDEVAAAPVRKKKLPFKPTALRNLAPAPKPAASTEDDKKSEGDDDDDDGLDLFRQSREMAPIMAAERERRLNKKKQKQAEEERRMSDMADKQLLESFENHEEDALALPVEGLGGDEAAEATPVDDSLRVDGDGFSRALATPPPSKRSRRDSDQGSRSSKRRRSTAEPLEGNPFHDSPAQRSTRSNSNLHTPSKRPHNVSVTPSGAPLIDLDSVSESESEFVSGSDDGADAEDHNVSTAAPPSAQQREDSVEFVGSGTVGEDLLSPTLRPQGTAEMEEEEEEDDDDEFDEYVRKAEAQRARDKDMMQMDSERAVQKDAAAEIMVQSNIPGTKTVCIRYQFNRPLRLIRDSWIALQTRKGVQLPITSDNNIVLTWQQKRVYTYSTLLSLGIRPQGDGKIIADEYSKGGLLDGRTKVALEAWTDEGFRQWELEEATRLKREAGELPEEEPTREQEEKRAKLRVKLVARDMEVVKLSVLQETTVETLIIGFRTQRGIGSDKDVGIWFDGERLEEHQTMEDAGIDEMDTLEVHIK
ncbi:ubiquitin-2 like Rad60 SUMO-like domain-containing protein [Trichoderma novae-zelandiae]